MKFRNLIILVAFSLIIILVVNVSNIVRTFYPLKYSQYIYKYSAQYGVDPYLIAAVIKAESNFKTNAVSSKNAYGLMQITPSTAEWAAGEMKISDFNKERLSDPEFNIKMGCWYIDNLGKEFNGNMDLILAAYNGGRGNVQKWLKDLNHSKDGETLHYIPFKETDKYVKRVKVNYNVYKFIYGS